MITPDYVRLMARYGQWQNRCVADAASQLSAAQRGEDSGLFFGSITNTLNHLLWGDQLWLSRLADTKAPTITSINESVNLHDDWQAYLEDRDRTDSAAVAWAQDVQAADLEGLLSWTSQSKGTSVTRDKWTLVVQLFNHGTHHRGQVHGVLTRFCIATPDTDVQYIP